MHSLQMELSLHFAQIFFLSANMDIFPTSISSVLVIGLSNAHAILLKVWDDFKDSSGV